MPMKRSSIAPASALDAFAQKVIEATPECIKVLDRDGRLLDMNPAGLAMIEAESLQEVLEQSVFDLIVPEDRERYIDFHRRVCAGATASLIYEMIGLHGTRRTMESHAVPIQRNGQASHLSVTRDITSRKLAEDELRAGKESLRVSEQRFRELADAIPQIVWIASPDGGLNHLNARATEYSGVSSENLTGWSWESVIHPDDLPSTLSQWHETLTTGIARDIEFRIRRADGEYRWHIARQVPARDKSGQIQTWYGTCTDIEDLKRSEFVLRESEERYRRLIDVLPDAVYMNIAGRIRFCNPKCLELFGATKPEQILGKSAFELFHPDYHELIRQRVARMRDTGQPSEGVREKILRLDGQEVPVHVVATPITEGGVEAVLVCLHDLTEHERSMEVLQSVLDSVQDAILTTDERGVIEVANPGVERLFGYSVAEVVGSSVKVLMPDPNHSENNSYLHNYRGPGDAKVIGVGREVLGRRMDGTTFPVELSVSEFLINGRRQFTGVVRDITKRKRLEEQFRQAQKMEAVGRLAGGVAHDFNNLLTVINGYSDLMMMQIDGGNPHLASVQAIRDAGERAARLTQQLLSYSRRAIIEPKVLKLNDLVLETTRLLRRLIGENILLTVDPDPELARIKADPSQLEQVVMNLVVNARDSMPMGGRLTIATQNVTLTEGDRKGFLDLEPGDYVRLTITDTGHGMSDKVKSAIFEPFFTTKEVGQGTGLGLAVVHGVVKQCGGSVEVESELGTGTTFTVLIPAMKEFDGETDSRPREDAPTGHETVLLVEDEPAVRRVVRIALETKGYLVLEACNGNQAIEAARNHAGLISVLVTDVVMPHISGRELAATLRAMRPNIRVLYISGYMDDAIIRHEIEDSTDTFLQKPFSPLTLARKVREILDGGIQTV
ncbi:MAG: PAS domain S-box protein [Planctomycetes bacterium]|nr:PAS domain S-box protein [Planctomycetota bacterium]